MLFAALALPLLSLVNAGFACEDNTKVLLGWAPHTDSRPW